MSSFDDERLKKRIGWLNNVGGFENSLIYTKIAEASEGLPDNKIMEVLKHLEDSQDKVWEPMRWVISSLNKAQDASEGLDEDFDKRLRRRIRWLNSEGGFDNKIQYSNIAEAAVGIDPRKVLEVLRFLEERWEYVEDATAWVCSALRKAAAEVRSEGGGSSSWTAPVSGKGGGAKGTKGSSKGGGKASKGYADDIYSKLWRRIQWLNSEGGFNNSINHSKVAEKVEGVDPSEVLDLLNYLEENWHAVGAPTAFLCSSLDKARSGSGCYGCVTSTLGWKGGGAKGGSKGGAKGGAKGPGGAKSSGKGTANAGAKGGAPQWKRK